MIGDLLTQLGLDRIEQVPINDGGLLAGQGLALEGHLSDVKSVAKQISQRATGEWNASGGLACLQGPHLFRPKNFAALEMGRSFMNVDGTWWIVLTAAETKEKRPDERPVPEELTDPIKRYLEIYRPILARGDTGRNSLWLAMDGKSMST